jgi:hypothetical protein
MPFTVIDLPPDEDHECETPNPYEYPYGTVIECDECKQRWYVNKFRLWDKTDWGKK